MLQLKQKLGEILVKSGCISEAQLKEALEHQKTSKKKLGQLLVDLGYLTEYDICQTLSFQLGIPFVDIGTMALDWEVVSLISEELAAKHLCLPVEIKEGELCVAMANPLNLVAIDDIRAVTGYEVRPLMVTTSDVVSNIEKYYHIDRAIEQLVEGSRNDDHIEIVTIDENEKAAQSDADATDSAPVVRLVNLVFADAIRAKASDIHLEPQAKGLQVRYRIDGMLRDLMLIPKHVQSLVLSRVKILCEMDIAERRKPQDGRTMMKAGAQEVDLRVSALPSIYGEKIVIRILDKSASLKDLDRVGFLPENKDTIERLLRRQQGIILVTGPTGSGKTSTLYACLNAIKSRTHNIITVEDPVEYNLDGITQVHVHEKAGLTFANALRSILRQDPDIIMVGEIRDTEVARIAFQAALTGHLVLSTLHTNDAPSALTRLIDLGIEPYLVSSSVIGIVAQRLARTLCPACKEHYEATEPELLLFGAQPIASDAKFYRAVGCKQCTNLGYVGRTAIFEILGMGTSIRREIMLNSGGPKILEAARLEGMRTLREDGLDKVAQGITTFEEVLRLTYSEKDSGWRCPECHRPVERSFKVCPNCHADLRPDTCIQCSATLESHWTVCPYCGSTREVSAKTKLKGAKADE